MELSNELLTIFSPFISGKQNSLYIVNWWKFLYLYKKYLEIKYLVVKAVNRSGKKIQSEYKQFWQCEADLQWELKVMRRYGF